MQLKFAIAALVGAIVVVAPATSSSTSPGDGWIAFVRQSGTGGVGDIYRVRPDGTGERLLTRTHDNFDPAFSPDGTRIAFVSARAYDGPHAHELYVMDVNGKTVRRLTRSLNDESEFSSSSQPAWHPDGKRIVFVRTIVRRATTSTDLWEVNADGTGLRRLTRHPRPEGAPTWMANGRTLTFVRDGTIYGLYQGRLHFVRKGIDPAWAPAGSYLAFSRDGVVYATLGGREWEVAKGTAPAWSPDGKRIVYFTPDGLFSANPFGGDKRRVTEPGEVADDLAPSWGAGTARTLAAAEPTRELAFARGGDIFAVGSDGTGARRLTTTRTHESAPAWSPDGRRIAFHRYVRGRNSEIVVADADGRNARRITSHPDEDLAPVWSPDGRRIAFASNRAGEYEIHVVDADGSNLRRVTRIARRGYGSFSPSWSPDGRWIVFSGSGPTPENPELYVIRPDGTGLKRITRTRGDLHTLGDDGMPDWSPDGRTIVFTSNRTGEGELWVIRPDGRGQRRLVGLPRRDDWAPRFSPDGEWIAFESRPAQGSDIYLVRKDGTGLRRLVLRASSPGWRP